MTRLGVEIVVVTGLFLTRTGYARNLFPCSLLPRDHSYGNQKLLGSRRRVS